MQAARVAWWRKLAPPDPWLLRVCRPTLSLPCAEGLPVSEKRRHRGMRAAEAAWLAKQQRLEMLAVDLG